MGVRVWLDNETGTWGYVDDLLITDCDVAAEESLDKMTPEQVIAFANDRFQSGLVQRAARVFH